MPETVSSLKDMLVCLFLLPLRCLNSTSHFPKSKPSCLGSKEAPTKELSAELVEPRSSDLWCDCVRALIEEVPLELLVWVTSKGYGADCLLPSVASCNGIGP